MDNNSPFTDPDEAKNYLYSLSAHPFRLGDTSFLHPDFAIRMANAIQQAKAQGLPLTVQSGYRSNTQTGSVYDAAGYSLHGVGAAMDVGGLGGPNSPQAQQWAKIAAQNGIYNPYGIDNPREFNHWQMIPDKLENRPDIMQNIKAANGNQSKIWDAIAPVQASATAYTDTSKGVDPFKEFNTATASTPNKSQTVDPFKEFSTDSGSTQPVSTQQAVDPFKEFPTEDVKPQVVQTPQVAAPVSPISNFTPVQAASPQVTSTLASAANSVPIIGPYIKSAAEHVAAVPQTILNGGTYAQNLQDIQNREVLAQEQHPNYATAGNVIGGVAGSLPIAAAAPELLGSGITSPFQAASVSGATNAALSGADAYSRTGDLNQAKSSALFGGIVGSVAPWASYIGGRAAENLGNTLTTASPAAKKVADFLAAVGKTPQDIKNASIELGPNSMVMDTDPALTALAGATAQRGGLNATSVLRNAATARAAGADSRIYDTVERALGPNPDVEALKNGIEDKAQTAAEPYYANATKDPLDVSPVTDKISELSTNAVGGTKAVLDKFKPWLYQNVEIPDENGISQTVSIPKSDPQALLAARQEMDGTIKSLQKNGSIDGTTAGGNAYRAALKVRSELDNVLKTNDGIRQGDQAYANTINLKNSLDYGKDVFGTETRLPEFQRTVASSTPEQLNTMRQGALSAIYDSIGQARRGELSAAQSFFSKASNNRAKLQILFPNADDLLDQIHKEVTMRASENAVKSGSQTSANQALGKIFEPTSPGTTSVTPAVVGNALAGAPGAAIAQVGQSIFSGMKSAAASNATNALAKGLSEGLSATGNAKNAFLRQIEKAYNASKTTSALTSGADLLTNLGVRQLGPNVKNYWDNYANQH